MLDDSLHAPHHEYDELPAYSRRRRHHTHPREPKPRSEHAYELSSSTSPTRKPWATLTLNSSAKHAHQIPTFFADEPILGAVALDLDREDAIQSVSITVTGRLVTGSTATDVLTFLAHTHSVWSKADTSFAPTMTNAKRNSKLSGQHAWPFSFTLPKKVSLQSPDGPMQTYRLPQTFVERYVKASVQYDLAVCITRGKLRTDSFIQAQIAYIPSTRPSPFSELRLLAYRENSPLLPPETDPAGWHVLPRLRVKPGVDALLALAKPLSYTRGTVIPVFVTLYGTGTSGAVLAPPALRLVRRTRYTCQGQSTDVAETVEPAVWWPADQDGAGNDGERRMYGEVPLKKDLKPSTALAHFSLAYALAVLQTAPATPFGPTNGAESSANGSAVEVEVEVVTQHAHGPRVRAYAPPSYHPATATAERRDSVTGVRKCVIPSFPF